MPKFQWKEYRIIGEPKIKKLNPWTTMKTQRKNNMKSENN